MGKDIERRVLSSEFEPTWEELLTPIAGAMKYTERAGRTLTENSNSSEYNKYCWRMIWGVAKLGVLHVAEGIAIVGAVYYFSR